MGIEAQKVAYSRRGSVKMLELNSIIERNADVIAAETGKDLVMVSISNGLYYGVSDTAREIWESLEQPKQISELIDHLCSTYEIDPASCQEQTLSFLDSLLSERLLKVKK
jgi:hypothetical protein